MRSRVQTALLGAACVLGLCLAVVDTPSRASPTDPPTDTTEPITGDPADGFPDHAGDQTGPITPFAPSQAHPSDVQIEDLTPDEQAYVEANLDTTAWPAIHNAYAAATAQTAAEAQAHANANLVGLDGINVGVVP
jgi:hypothetical protein